MTEKEKLCRDRNRKASESVRHPQKRDLVWGNSHPVAQDALSDTFTATFIDPYDYGGFDTPPRQTVQPETIVEDLGAGYVEWNWDQSSLSRKLEQAYLDVARYVALPMLATGLVTLTWSAWTSWRDARRRQRAARIHAKDWMASTK